MKLSSRLTLNAGLLCWVGTAAIRAEVIATVDLEPPTWEPTPVIASPDPGDLGTFATYVGSRGLQQTIQAPVTFKVDKIGFIYSTSSNFEGEYLLSIYEVPGPHEAEIQEGGNLLPSGSTFQITQEENTSRGLLMLDLTGEDEIMLEAGKAYAIQLTRKDGNNLQLRGFSDASEDGRAGYDEGTVYYAGKPIASGSCSLAFAVYAVDRATGFLPAQSPERFFAQSHFVLKKYIYELVALEISSTTQMPSENILENYSSEMSFSKLFGLDLSASTASSKPLTLTICIL